MTVLDRLVRKGAVSRRKAGRAFIYQPVLSRATLRRLAVKQLLESLFGGSEDELLGYLQGSEPQRHPAVIEEPLDTALL